MGYLENVKIPLPITVYVLAMVGHLKNVSPTFAQMPNRITNVEFTTFSPTIADTMLAVRLFMSMLLSFIVQLFCVAKLQLHWYQRDVRLDCFLKVVSLYHMLL